MDKLIHVFLKIPGLSWLAEAALGHYVTIFMLHRSQAETPSLLGTDPAILERCLRFAKENGFQFLSIDEVVTLALRGETPDRPSICFTLDDGFLDQTEALVPLLLKYDAKPTIFVLKDFVSQRDWPWDAKVNYLLANAAATEIDFEFEANHFHLDTSNTTTKIKTRREIVSYLKRCYPEQAAHFIGSLSGALDMPLPTTAPLHYNAPDWDRLRQLEQQGLRIGSHATSHHPFTSLTDLQISEELSASVTALKGELKNPSNVFCYPSGTEKDFAPHHEKLVEAAGFSGAVSAIAGNTTLKSIALTPFSIPRHSFPTSFHKFVRYTSWIEFVRSKLS